MCVMRSKNKSASSSQLLTSLTWINKNVINCKVTPQECRDRVKLDYFFEKSFAKLLEIWIEVIFSSRFCNQRVFKMYKYKPPPPTRNKFLIKGDNAYFCSYFKGARLGKRTQGKNPPDILEHIISTSASQVNPLSVCIPKKQVLSTSSKLTWFIVIVRFESSIV